MRSPLKAPRKRLYTEEREKVSRSPAKREKPVVRREFSSQTTTRTNQRNAGTRPRLTATRSAGGLGRGRVGGSPRKLSGRAASRSIGAGSTASGTKTEDGSDSVLKEQHQRQQGNESLENPLSRNVEWAWGYVVTMGTQRLLLLFLGDGAKFLHT
ncbi:hypothetical protein K2173_001750 [Erythroxylum novogranatense]|uniref:Uncharacterized protein n=1 Tax=Erythroxylum novogranatense TaxID=1862640 RepID=A0AAV8S803_9ROSI|nr:hypothetical protein K2173_001750 [Erythroxylum novogranatense]